MSDLMLHGVLNMPLPDDPTECDLVTWFQFKDRARQASSRITALEAENAAFRAGLASIASNTCCTTCQEAALVAKATLRKEATK